MKFLHSVVANRYSLIHVDPILPLWYITLILATADVLRYRMYITEYSENWLYLEITIPLFLEEGKGGLCSLDLKFIPFILVQ